MHRGRIGHKSGSLSTGARFRARRGHLTTLCGLLPESQGQDLALTVLFVPNSLVVTLLCVPTLKAASTGDRTPSFFSPALLSSLELSDAKVYEP